MSGSIGLYSSNTAAERWHDRAQGGRSSRPPTQKVDRCRDLSAQSGAVRAGFFREKAMINRTATLRRLLAEERFIDMPVAYDPLGGRLIESLGFKTVYNGGVGARGVRRPPPTPRTGEGRGAPPPPRPKEGRPA